MYCTGSSIVGRCSRHSVTWSWVLLLFSAVWPLWTSGQQVKNNLSGRWLLTLDFKGTVVYQTLEVRDNNGSLTGKLSGDQLTGSHNGSTVTFVAKDADHSASAEGELKGSIINGTVTFKDSDTDSSPTKVSFTATPMPRLPTHAPQRHELTPTVFYRQFSPFNKPVLHIAPGDSVHTGTVDAGGTDETGQNRSAGGNPETGPFYIDGAMPGDTLIVHILKLRLSRDWAVSDDAIVGRALDSDLAVTMKDTGKTVRWHLDRERGVAYPENRSGHLAKYEVAIRPMLGCVATAPGPASAPPPTGDSGPWGGNMDFNEVGEGTTLYLPVSNPGALLYLGDGHALQGDGELNGNALETSMDVEFSVDVTSGKRVPAARLDTADHIAATGYAGSLDEALKAATSNMAEWLKTDYQLTPSEIAQVVGSAAEYRIAEVADRNAGVVLKLQKTRLGLLVKPTTAK